MQLFSAVSGVPRPRPGVAPAETSAIAGHDTTRRRQGGLDPEPVGGKRGHAGLQQDRWTWPAVAHDLEVEAVTTNIDQPTRRWESASIDFCRDGLIGQADDCE